MPVVARQPLHPDAPLGGNGFFPELSLEDFQRSQRVDASVAAETLRDVLQAAISRIQRASLAWQCQQIQAGYLDLQSVPADTVGDDSVLVIAYRLSVYLRAKGELLKYFANLSLSDKGSQEFEKKTEQANWYFNQSSRELRTLLGKTPTRVSLI